ncbi:MAG: redox-sensing transcriptional repressor Rex [Erysipelotrichaceae bacterium]|nr:redox-sensing transcriptional repressor Rex [Erysipelotrichaceae bacterium]MDD3923895.1 redox-sensing transcriptional repressor Rex [Erysipelotrichaceae bacterium]MDD4642026.1 redox-sensing transcriptional repressor Rex [Erysipelotrichaceae bacterium]
MTNNKIVPKATLQRYPIYLKALRKLKSQGISKILSSELSDYVDIESTTIRRDFSFLGTLGKQGYGYDIDSLIAKFNSELGVNFDEKIILIGVGNLGRALMNYNRWNHVVGEIVCGFDIDPKVIDSKCDVPVYHLDQLCDKMPENCRIAILTISQNIQETVDKLVDCGIIGLVDFSNEHIRVPKGVTIKAIDVVSAIQELVFSTNFNKEQ